MTFKYVLSKAYVHLFSVKDYVHLFSVKDPKRKFLAKELEEEENALKQSIEKLKLVEASRVALVSQLREALNEQVCNFIIIFFFTFN